VAAPPSPGDDVVPGELQAARTSMALVARLNQIRDRFIRWDSS
jgi:hypothetical protein